MHLDLCFYALLRQESETKLRPELVSSVVREDEYNACGDGAITSSCLDGIPHTISAG